MAALGYPQQFQEGPGMVHPVEFQLRGVSFNGRQRNVQQLFTGQPVQFVPEPDNPYDSNAILVKTLAGLELGHVPRELTERFPSELTELFPNQVLLGEVVSIKMAETVDMYGALFISFTEGMVGPDCSACEEGQGLVHPLEFMIRGVSFDGRQENVVQLVPGQPVQFVPEPDNPFDSNAILIKTLAGLELGYVPRELNDLFPNQVLLGEVVLMGMAKTVELCGAMVRVMLVIPQELLEA